MIWAILALLGVPLWLCAIGIFALVFRNRTLRRRHGNLPVRVRRPDQTRWTRGHAIWISDVFAWRGSPAAWSEDLMHVSDAALRTPDRAERKKLHRLADEPAIATLVDAKGTTLEVAVPPEQRSAVLGPFAHDAPSPSSNDGGGRSRADQGIAPVMTTRRSDHGSQ